jgi:hypothetical protein
MIIIFKELYLSSAKRRVKMLLSRFEICFITATWGIDTAMKALVPKASYDITSAGGTFIIDRWDSIFPQPTSQEIRDEYIRQQTIAECIEYFKNKQ